MMTRNKEEVNYFNGTGEMCCLCQGAGSFEDPAWSEFFDKERKWFLIFPPPCGRSNGKAAWLEAYGKAEASWWLELGFATPPPQVCICQLCHGQGDTSRKACKPH